MKNLSPWEKNRRTCVCLLTSSWDLISEVFVYIQGIEDMWTEL